MWRVLSIVEQMSQSLTQASAYLTQALTVMDAEMTQLQGRLHEDAMEMRSAVEEANFAPEEHARVIEALERMERTATAVAGFAHRHRVGPSDEPPPS